MKIRSIASICANYLLIVILLMPFKAHSIDAGSAIDPAIAAVEDKVIAWRRDIHQHPELGNRETRTAKLVADHLRMLGMEVRTGIAYTGVLGVLKGAKPGPVVALRADMDALPVKEMTGLPFASKVTTNYKGKQTGVMHACGHDAHVAMLMGAAEVLAKQRQQIAGTIMFIFQPAEEGAPAGEEGGAELMLKQGLFDKLVPDAVFGLHIGTGALNSVAYGSGPILAAADSFTIHLTGKQTHGSMPWFGVDPITLSAQVVLGLQTIASRRVDLMVSPAVISVGSIHGGIRNNIIPGQVVMEGTIRTFNEQQRKKIHRDIEQLVTNLAAASGAQGKLEVSMGYPTTINDPALVEQMLPTVKRVTGADKVIKSPRAFGAEDFSFLAQKAPGVYLWLGATPENKDPLKQPPNHSPYFSIDERALLSGVKLLTHMTLDFINNRQ